MNDRQRAILKKMMWVCIFLIILFVFFFFWPKFTGGNQEEAASSAHQFFNWAKWLMLIPFLVGPFILFAFIWEFFKKQKIDETGAATADVLLTIQAPNRRINILFGLLITLSFTVILMILLFRPDIILEQHQLDGITSTEKLIFGFFSVLCMFLLIAGGRQLFTNQYVFIATTKGFQYTPAGINIGWILWEEVDAVREASVLSGNGLIGAITTIPVLGIRLRNPDDYAKKYNPALQKLVSMTGKFNNFQTEGVGDIVLKLADFGKRYKEVITLIESRVQLKNETPNG